MKRMSLAACLLFFLVPSFALAQTKPAKQTAASIRKELATLSATKLPCLSKLAELQPVDAAACQAQESARKDRVIELQGKLGNILAAKVSQLSGQVAGLQQQQNETKEVVAKQGKDLDRWKTFESAMTTAFGSDVPGGIGNRFSTLQTGFAQLTATQQKQFWLLFALVAIVLSVGIFYFAKWARFRLERRRQARAFGAYQT
mgnify:CR=1 FL=1